MGVGRPLAVGGGAASLVVALLVMLLGGDPSDVPIGCAAPRDPGDGRLGAAGGPRGRTS